MALDPSIDLSTALLSMTSAVLAVAVAWALLVLLLASWRPTARWAAALTPRVLRAALFTGVTGVVALGPMPANADDLNGLPLPDRPVTSTISDQSERIVSTGQTLWSIAASGLGPHASPATIAEESMRWYRHNRAVIGDNPDLIIPGQVLRAPNGGQTQ